MPITLDPVLGEGETGVLVEASRRRCAGTGRGMFGEGVESYGSLLRRIREVSAGRLQHLYDQYGGLVMGVPSAERLWEEAETTSTRVRIGDRTLLYLPSFVTYEDGRVSVSVPFLNAHYEEPHPLARQIKQARYLGGTVAAPRAGPGIEVIHHQGKRKGEMWHYPVWRVKASHDQSTSTVHTVSFGVGTHDWKHSVAFGGKGAVFYDACTGMEVFRLFDRAYGDPADPTGQRLTYVMERTGSHMVDIDQLRLRNPDGYQAIHGMGEDSKRLLTDQDFRDQLDLINNRFELVV